MKVSGTPRNRRQTKNLRGKTRKEQIVDIVVRNATIKFPNGNAFFTAEVEEGQVTALLARRAFPTGKETLDLGNLDILIEKLQTLKQEAEKV